MPEMTDQGAGLERGNPTQGADTGKEEAGSFLTGLVDKPGSGTDTASQDGTKAGNVGEDQGSAQQTTTLPGFAAGLSKELKADKAVLSFTGKFKSMDDLVKSAMAAESKLGSMVSIPDDKASPEQIVEFYKKLGVPEKPEDYKLEEDEKVKVDPAQAAEFRKLAKELNLTQAQAEKLWKNANEYTAKALTDHQKMGAEAAKQAELSLRKEWGNDYAKNLSAVQRGLAIYPRQGELIKEAKQFGFDNSTELVKLFHFIGSLLKEDVGPARMGVGGSGQIKGGIDRPGL